MISTILNKKTIPYLIIAGLLVYIFSMEKEIIQVKIPSKENSVKIADPISEVRVDTIYKTVFRDGKRKVVKEVVTVENPVNKDLLDKYEEAKKSNDSLLLDKIFREAITERLYTEKLVDSVQTITVKSEVIGTLKSQIISYKTNPQTITIKKWKRASIYIGGFSYLPTIDGESISVGLQLQVVNKKRVLTFGFDNTKKVHVGIAFKLF